MEKLIISPLKATGIPTLIIIDALDECKDTEPASAILSILSHYINEIPDVKFFITGRPEVRICSGFRLEPPLWELVHIPTSTCQYAHVLTQNSWTDGSVHIFTEESVHTHQYYEYSH